MDSLTSFFDKFPTPLATFLIAMVPLGELRIALPIALTVYHLPFWTAYWLSVLGNLLPATLLVYLLEPLSRWLSARSRTARRFFDWLFARTRRKHGQHFERYGAFLALATFVAIPLPLTGAWSGAVAGFVFGLSRRVTLLANAVGVMVAGLAVGATVTGLRAMFP